MFKATDVQMCVSRLMMPAVPWSAEPRTLTHNRKNLQQETEGCCMHSKCHSQNCGLLSCSTCLCNCHHVATSSYHFLLLQLHYGSIVQLQLLSEHLFSVMAQVWSCPFGAAWRACHHRQHCWKCDFLSTCMQC